MRNRDIYGMLAWSARPSSMHRKIWPTSIPEIAMPTPWDFQPGGGRRPVQE